nr:ATP-binding protein [Baaleninema simplex]
MALEDLSKSPQSQHASLRVPTDLNALVRVLEWFDRLESPAVPQRIWLQCKTALAEGFTNAVRHAHRDRGDDDLPIEVEFEQTPTYLELRILDSGPPFDLEGKLNNLPTSSDLHATGGRGLKLMQCIADRLSYKRLDDKRNCLSILKYYESEP